jgi:hypothetical protein
MRAQSLALAPSAARLLCLLLALAAFSLALANPVSAKYRPPYDGGAIDLALCQATADPDKNPLDVNVIDKKGQLCCSKELNYCIDCSRKTGSCKLLKYRVWPGRGQRPQAPGYDTNAPLGNAPAGMSRPKTKLILTFPGTVIGN